MSAVTLNKISHIDKNNQYTVFGYIRNVQKLLLKYHSKNNDGINISFYNIPDLI